MEWGKKKKEKKIRDKCDGFAGQHMFKISRAGNGGEAVLLGCRSNAVRCDAVRCDAVRCDAMRLGDAFTRWS
jgi:hypothetical protein